LSRLSGGNIPERGATGGSIDTAQGLHDSLGRETISQNAKATLGRDKQHLEEEKEIEVAKVAGLRNIDRLSAPNPRPTAQPQGQRDRSSKTAELEALAGEAVRWARLHTCSNQRKDQPTERL